MTEYNYTVDSTDWNLMYLQGKVYAALDTTPTEGIFSGGLSSGGMGPDSVITVITDRDLTAGEKTALDTLMTDVNAGKRPETTGNTVIEIPNFINSWKTLETDASVEISFVCMNPATGNIEMWISGDVNSTKRNALLQSFRDGIKITKY